MKDENESDEEMYSITSSQTFYKKSRSRSSVETRTLPKILVSSDSDERQTSQASSYLPVTRWAVDYNNKNYVRSMCNKNKGFHRQIRGRPLNWHIQYDNSYFDRSNINAPKGLHRKIPEISRKYVPDHDELADATGWEFDCGPEFDQVEQDVLYVPEGKIITRGCYRWYGAKRNDSDCDIKEEHQRENLLSEELTEEQKYGQEFMQADIPHMKEPIDKRYSRGSYRYYEVPRNVYDINTEEMASSFQDPEWRRKHHSNGYQYMDLDMCDYEADDGSVRRSVIKGKPFRRTVLNKVHEMVKRKDSRESVKRRGTRLSLVPGEGPKTHYEGTPDLFQFEERKPSYRNIFKKKSEKYKSGREGNEYEEYQRTNEERRYSGIGPEHENKLRKIADEKRTYLKTPSENEEEEARRDRRGDERHKEYVYRTDSNEPEGTVTSKRSLTDIQEDEETVKEDKRTYYRRKTSDERREEIYRGDRPSREADSGEMRDRRTKKRSPPDTSEDFESRTESDTHQKQRNESRHYLPRKKSKDRHVEMYSDRNYPPPRDMIVEKRRQTMNVYDNNDHHISNARHRHHKQGEVAEEKRDRFMKKVYDQDDNYRQRKSISSSERRHDRFHQEKEDSNQMRRRGTRDYEGRDSLKSKGSSRSSRDVDYEVELTPGKDETLKRLPPHVEERVKEIREKMEKKMKHVDFKHKDHGERHAFGLPEIDDNIDLMKHKSHPKDRGETHDSEYEKYVTKNGSEIWVKKEEKFIELHHRDD